MGGIGWSMFDLHFVQRDRAGNLLEILQMTTDYVAFDVLLAGNMIISWEE